jgi:ArsR family transcriptional regulator, arsenate/arsenite/antimonite-responsive transcriptional repressor
MKIKKTRQILKALADDNRLRIVNLLNNRDLTVKEICLILNKNQSSISKHLARLRLSGIAEDTRKGMNVFYRLAEPENKKYEKLLRPILESLAVVESCRDDVKKIKDVKGEE